MNILYLTPDMSRYDSAMYQQDVIAEIARQARVRFYGPGFSGYNPRDTIDDVIAKGDVRPEWIIVGHAWLRDTDGTPVNQYPHIDLARTTIPKAAILNKEYASLEAKLAELARIGVDLVFSHHHDAESLSDRLGRSVLFWPFAFDHRRFFVPSEPKTIDLGFSGILQNPTPGRQSDLRVRIMQELFECEGDLPVRARPTYAGLNMVYNALPRDQASRDRNAVLKIYRRLSDADYAALVRSSRIFLCTRSPADLVSPRLFECLASGTRVIAERNPGHARVFAPGTLAEFDDVEGFVHAFDAERRATPDPLAITALAGEIRRRHSWEARVGELLRALCMPATV